MELDCERITELVGLLKASSAAELTVQENGVTIRLVRALPESLTAATAEPVVTVANGEAPAVVVSPLEAAAAAAPVPEAVTVKSRFVGLFYPGKEPGGPPLVELGQEVAEGQVLGVVEVLRKPMNVTSPVAGVLSEVVAEEGAPVQYGDALFLISPQGHTE